MRIAPMAFAALDMDALEELAGLYNTKNHKLFTSLAKEAKRHERVNGRVHVRRHLDVAAGHQ